MISVMEPTSRLPGLWSSVLHGRRNSVSRATHLTAPGLTDTMAQGCFSSSTHPQKSGPLAKSGAILFPASGSWNSTGHPLCLFARTEILSSLSCAQTGMNRLASPARSLGCGYHMSLPLQYTEPFSWRFRPCLFLSRPLRAAGISKVRAESPFSQKRRYLTLSSSPCY